MTNWPAYDIALRQRGSLTVWFTEGDMQHLKDLALDSFGTDDPIPSLVPALPA